jgi:hypothetical protein
MRLKNWIRVGIAGKAASAGEKHCFLDIFTQFSTKVPIKGNPWRRSKSGKNLNFKDLQVCKTILGGSLNVNILTRNRHELDDGWQRSNNFTIF